MCKTKVFRNESQIVLISETFLLSFFSKNARNKNFLEWHAWATIDLLYRTVARKSSIGRLYVCAGGFTFVQGGLTFKFDKNSTNL